MVLVDTSIWIETFRRRRPLDLESLVEFDEIVTCFPVVQEVLQGFREDAVWRVAHESMLNLPMLEDPLRWDVFAEAVDLYRTARRQGLTIRSGVDCLVAACALRNDCEVLHHDRDFAALAHVSRLRQRSA